ncbi:DUF1425 domain-containing protein [Parasphingorhabdus sp.]|uniref:DUF1425 domain-containing protein n=1 Tax=Parasphingorhabdus sp. TaxID=2709688 RepID=UPI0035937F11
MMSILRTKVIYSAVAASLLAGGCTTYQAPEGGYRIDNQNSVSPTLNTVRVIDGSLARYKNRQYEVRSVLDVERVNLSRSATGFPQISVEFRNKAEFDIPLEVRASWYDAAGRPVDAAASWSRVFAQPMSMALFTQTSSNAAASQYYVEVRAAQ